MWRIDASVLEPIRELWQETSGGWGKAQRCPRRARARGFASSATSHPNPGSSTRLFVVICLCVILPSAETADAESGASAERSVVVATVDGEPIYAGELDRLLSKVTRGQQVNPAAVPWLRAGVLAEIVDRRLVLAYARRTKSGAPSPDVDAAISALKSKLTSQGRSLDDHLRQQSTTEAGLRRQITWNLTWKKYLARYVTQQRLRAYFDAHRRGLDGTRVSVSHVLLQPPPDAKSPKHGPAAMAKLLRRAEVLREAIVSGELSFAEAAQKHSAGPSAKQGGRLGPIARHGAMVEAFSRAAFKLEVGQTSPPVRTRFGVHLIRCDRIQPGSKEITEVREQLEEALAGELLDKLAGHQRRHTPVKFTGAAPYFKPRTRELVVP